MAWGWFRTAATLVALISSSCATGPTRAPPETAIPAAPVEPVGSDQGGATGPSALEWQSATRVEVPGAAALGCEAAERGDWLRIACRELSFFAGKPTGVTVHTRHPAGSVASSVGDGAASLVLRFREGTRLSASFVWGTEIFRFSASWPASSARPSPVGRFVGAPDKPAREILSRACACQPRTMPESGVDAFGCRSSDGTMDGGSQWPASCIRHLTSGNDCDEMNICLTFEPSHYKVCGDGELLTGGHPFRQCAAACGPELPCPSGFDCAPSEVMAESGLVPGPTVCISKD